MKDKALFFLFKLGRNPAIRQLYAVYYKLVINIVRSVLSMMPFIDSVYLKGSWGQSYFEPVLSDLDFCIVGDATPITKKKLKNIFKALSIFFPIVSDFNFFTKREFAHLIAFGDLKFYECHKWQVLKGQAIPRSYLHHPEKLYADILEALYFQLIWLFRNLKRRKTDTPYLSLGIQRQYDKMQDLLNFLYDDSVSTIQYREFCPNYRWLNFSNEEIIQKFLNLLGSNYNLTQITACLKHNFADRQIDEVLQLDYFQENLVLVKGEFTYAEKELYLTRDLLELFYWSGCIDSKILLERARYCSDAISAYFLQALHQSKSIEMEVEVTQIDQPNKFERVKKMDKAYYLRPPNTFGKYVILSLTDQAASAGIGIFENLEWLKKEGLELIFFHISESRNLEESGVPNDNISERIRFHEIAVDTNGLDERIPQTFPLLEFGMSYCWGAKNILVIDPNIYLTKEILQEFYKKEIKTRIPSAICNPEENIIFMGAHEVLSRIEWGVLCNWNLFSNSYVRYLLSGDNYFFLDHPKLFLETLEQKVAGFEIEDWELTLQYKSATKPRYAAKNLLAYANSLVERRNDGFWHPKKLELEKWYEIGFLFDEDNMEAFLNLKDILPDIFKDLNSLELPAENRKQFEMSPFEEIVIEPSKFIIRPTRFWNQDVFSFSFMLDRVYLFGYYRMFFIFYFEPQKNEQIDVQLTREDVAVSSLQLKGNITNGIDIYLDEYVEAVDCMVRFQNRREEFGFEILKIEPIDFENKSYAFMGEFSFPNVIERAYVGFYKLVIKTSREYSGGLFVQNEKFKSPVMDINDLSQFVYYFFAPFELDGLEIIGPKDITKVDLLFAASNA